MARLIDADKYCEFLNTYPLDKAQNNFMSFYREALQKTFECEVKAIPIRWIQHYIKEHSMYGAIDDVFVILHTMLCEWEKENEADRH